MKMPLLILFSLFMLHSFAQEHTYGWGVGASIVSVERNNYDYYYSAVGFSMDGIYNFRKGVFYSKSALGYQQKGFKQDIIYVDTNGMVLGEGAPESTKFSYFGFSETVGLTFGEKLQASIGVGVCGSLYAGTRVHSGVFTLNDGTTSGAYTYTFKNLKPIDFSGIIEAGLSLDKENKIYFVGVSYNYGLKDQRYKVVPTVDAWRNHYATIKVGVRHKFNSKKEE